MLDRIASVFQIVESIAVLTTLIFVYVQVKTANRIAVSSAYQNLTSTFNQFVMGVAQDEKLSELYTKGRYHPDRLDEGEKERFFLLCAQMFSFHENLYVLRETGSLPKELHEGWRMDIEKNMRQPGFLIYWQEQGDEYSSGFRENVSVLLK